ncbi:hypothetical protein PAXINDRAFT_103744 [Paxillus involutus ATCC 200175]|uniref:Uncharacterized protein n=1 Tax=Paxillus involutus ATCC 200175 TaxID=664439 RepID=A0A0C9TE67_PAXIN|nr:hypothetical protein PAXINDRAFT_103744 [Paxillus involutus ATCC 200175]
MFAPLSVDEGRKKRFAKFRIRNVFTWKKKNEELETQEQRPPKRAFKFRTMLTRKKKDETQSKSDHQQGVGGAEIDAPPETTPPELTAKGKGKQKEINPNPAPARHNGRASTRTDKHQPTTSASQTKREVRDRVARVRQAIMRRRDGSTARTHDRLENTTAGDRNSNERGAAGPSRMSRDPSNRRPWITFPRRIRNPKVVEIMEGHMPDRYVSGHKFAKKKKKSSVESESGSGSENAEDGTEDGDEAEEAPRNKTPGGLIGILCFCSCIP